MRALQTAKGLASLGLPPKTIVECLKINERNAALQAPWDVADLPTDFDRECPRFKAAHLKWELDRDGADWPQPRYHKNDVALVSRLGLIRSGFYYLVADLPDGSLWAMEVKDPA